MRYDKIRHSLSVLVDEGALNSWGEKYAGIGNGQRWVVTSRDGSREYTTKEIEVFISGAFVGLGVTLSE